MDMKIKKRIKKDDMNIKLIEEVKKNECLYNMKNPQYKEFEYKERLWAQIGKETGKTAIESKKKWKYIRDTYKRNKQIALTHTGFRKPYKYAESLKFLDNFSGDKHSKTITPSSADAEVSTDLSSDYEFEYEPFAKQTKHSFENSLDDVREFLEASSADEGLKTEGFNPDTSTKETVNIDEELSTVPETSNDSEESTTFPNEELRKRNFSQKLIDEVKKYECIYDLKSPQYKHFSYKKRLWHKIGKRVGVTGDDACRRWKSLRDSYRRYRIKTTTEEGFVTQYKYADDLRFLDDFSVFTPCAKRVKMSSPTSEVSTDLSSDDDVLTNQESASSSAKESTNPITITSRLFQLLVNKIYEANLTQQQKNDIEYTVSSLVYSKLAEYNKSKLNQF